MQAWRERRAGRWFGAELAVVVQASGQVGDQGGGQQDGDEDGRDQDQDPPPRAAHRGYGRRSVLGLLLLGPDVLNRRPVLVLHGREA